MDFDFEPFFKRYEAISAMADTLFNRVREQHPDAVTCKTRCADCCHALFDLSLIEAVYINHKFNEKHTGDRRERLLEKASTADRRIHKIKRNAAKTVADGVEESEVLARLALEKERCPLLNAEDLCDLYDHRPVTCRLYGIPTAIAGKGHTCGRTGFVQGRPYPTVNLESIQRMLFDLSHELVQALKSRHVRMGEILVPLSMAMLTDYNEAYLGMDAPEPEGGDEGEPNG